MRRLRRWKDGWFMRVRLGWVVDEWGWDGALML
jgi:hypothetical protein